MCQIYLATSPLFLTNNQVIIDLQKKGNGFDAFPFCGAEGVRTLVQLCDKLYLLHAYFPISCRDQSGWKPTLTFSLCTLFRNYTIPL